MIGDHSQRTEFSARIVFAHGEIQSCEVFTWELEPHDKVLHRSGRDWVYDHLTEGLDLPELFCNNSPCWEAVFKGTLCGKLDYFGEWDEEIDLDRHNDILIQPLPEEWFE
jgi:hypothetical protein